MNNDEDLAFSINKHSIISLVLGILTLAFICGGVVPIPLTGFVCFPAGFLFSIPTIIYGVISINKIKKSGETGLPIAWTGIAIGGFVFICMLCASVAIGATLIFAPDALPPLQPYLDKYL